MNFKIALAGFKTFKDNAKEIFDFRDFIAVICLFFSLGLLISKTKNEIVRKIKSVIFMFSLFASIPAIIKTVVAILAGISKYNEN